MDKDYMDKYKSIIYGITHVERCDGSGHPYYMDDYKCTDLEDLNKIFPNVSVSIKDLLRLSDLETEKHKNDLTIEDLQDSAYGYSFYERHGHSITKEEKAEYESAKRIKAKIDNNYTKSVSTFLEVCETLNDSDEMKDKDFNIEDLFEKMYEYKLDTRPKDTILRNYYERYKSFREKEKENKKLKEENTNLSENSNVLEEKNTNLNSENNELKIKNEKLTKLLSKTLAFCENVKNSRFGRFFFKKQIKALSEPNNDKEI